MAFRDGVLKLIFEFDLKLLAKVLVYDIVKVKSKTNSKQRILR